MQVNAEVSLHFAGQFAPWGRRVLAASPGRELHNLRRALAGLLGTPLARKQAPDPLADEGLFQKVEQLAADAEAPGHLRHRQAIDPMSPQHLVTDLDQVAGVEELRVAKQRISHARGMTMQSVAGLEELELGVRAFGHEFVESK